MALITRGTISGGKSVLAVTGAAAAPADTSDHILVAATTGLQILIDKLTVTNRSATDTMVIWKSNGVVIWYTPAPKAGGAVEAFPTALPCAHSAELTYAVADGVSTVYVCAAGYLQANS